MLEHVKVIYYVGKFVFDMISTCVLVLTYVRNSKTAMN